MHDKTMFKLPMVALFKVTEKGGGGRPRCVFGRYFDLLCVEKYNFVSRIIENNADMKLQSKR